MRHLLHKIVTKKTERLRACLLLALLITAGGLALGGKETPPTPAAPAEASEPGALSGLITAFLFRAMVHTPYGTKGENQHG